MLARFKRAPKKVPLKVIMEMDTGHYDVIVYKARLMPSGNLRILRGKRRRKREQSSLTTISWHPYPEWGGYAYIHKDKYKLLLE